MVTIDGTLMQFGAGTRLILQTDKDFVETSSLKVTPYDSGATRWDLFTNVGTTTTAERDYLTGIFIPNYIANEEFEITLPKEANYITDTGSRSYELTSIVGAGSNTLVLNKVGGGTITSGDIKQGRYFNVEGSSRMFIVNSMDTSTGILKFAPNLDKALAVDAVFDFKTPKLKMICTNKGLSRSFALASDDYSRISLTFMEGL